MMPEMISISSLYTTLWTMCIILKTPWLIQNRSPTSSLLLDWSCRRTRRRRLIQNKTHSFLIMESWLLNMEVFSVFVLNEENHLQDTLTDDGKLTLCNWVHRNSKTSVILHCNSYMTASIDRCEFSFRESKTAQWVVNDSSRYNVFASKLSE